MTVRDPINEMWPRRLRDGYFFGPSPRSDVQNKAVFRRQQFCGFLGRRMLFHKVTFKQLYFARLRSYSLCRLPRDQTLFTFESQAHVQGSVRLAVQQGRSLVPYFLL
jgi:hypothetical protein